MAVITLLTDFGTSDGYVAEIKGVLATLSPGATVMDMSHELPPQDVDAGRLAIARYWLRFPLGTVHLAVVDPGVGSARAALAVECEGRFLVGPDNGLLSPALVRRDARVVALPVDPQAAPTFHGRDVFAPAAAALANGDPLDALGVGFSSALVRRTPEAHRADDGALAGQVITIDHFGNATTNLLGARGGVIEVDGLALPVRRVYADANVGEPLALVGSTGFIEIAVRDGSAAAALGLERGTVVRLRH